LQDPRVTIRRGAREPKLARPHFDLRLVDLSNFCAAAISRIPIRRSPDGLALRVATAINEDERLDMRVKTKRLTE